MTTLLEREPRKLAAGDATTLLRAKQARFRLDLSPAARVLLATLSAAAGAVHLAMVPSHMSDSVMEGIGFLVVGWIQLALAVLLVTRVSRALLRVTMVVNFGAVAVWVISREFGLPFGAQPWQPHDIAFVDLATVGIEIALVFAAGLFLFRPWLAHGWDRRRLAVGAAIPLAVIGLTSAALGSPSALDHSHGSQGGTEIAAGGHSHDDGVASADADPSLKGLDLLENGHQHASGTVELDNATQTALASQLAKTASLVERYPTISAAEAAGYRRAGPFVPGLGTHYFRNDFGSDDSLAGVDGPMTPLLIFDGVEPDSPIAGFMYLANPGSRTEPEGFIGPNDHWHFHTNTCVVYKAGTIEAPLGADTEASKALCDKYGGSLIQNTGFMVHVWTVPGYESSRGTFSNINPALSCPDGTYYRIPFEKLGYKTSACRNA